MGHCLAEDVVGFCSSPKDRPRHGKVLVAEDRRGLGRRPTGSWSSKAGEGPLGDVFSSSHNPQAVERDIHFASKECTTKKKKKGLPEPGYFQ